MIDSDLILRVYSVRTNSETLMKRCFASAMVVGALMFANALPASATSIDGTYTAMVSGVSSTNVTGTFVFNTSTHAFTDALTFRGVFNVAENFKPKAATCVLNNCLVVLAAVVGGDTILYDIRLNLNSDQFDAGGYIWNSKASGAFNSQGQTSLPEGGSGFLYLGLTAVMIFGAFCLAPFRALQDRNPLSRGV